LIKVFPAVRTNLDLGSERPGLAEMIGEEGNIALRLQVVMAGRCRDTDDKTRLNAFVAHHVLWLFYRSSYPFSRSKHRECP
jgi:hypothetical protein